VDRARIRRWWRQSPDANIGVATGVTSGVVVIDVDPRHGGDDTLASLIATYGALPPGPTTATGGGGRHLWFAHPRRRVANDAGRLGPGLDVRGDGGYVLVPPSRHRGGGTYLWLPYPATPPPLPPWLDHLLARPRAARAMPTDAAGIARGASSIEEELARLRAAREGSRNTSLNLAAFNLGRRCRSPADAHGLEDLLRAEAARLGLSEVEASKTIASGFAAARPATDRSNGIGHV